MENFLIIWSEGNESFASEFSTTANGLRNWFELKVKQDHKKMSDVYLCRFVNNKLEEQKQIKSHKFIGDDMKVKEVINF